MRAIDRDFWREVRGTRSRFLSILILAALAVTFLSGLRATAPDMKRTCDSYLDAQNFMDIQILSTLGLTGEDVQALSAQEGVSDCEASYVVDAFAHTPALDIVAKVYSLPERLNLPTVEQGRMPRTNRECVVDKNLLSSLELSVGDQVQLVTEGDFEGVLPGGTYTIVGTVVSPCYISVERGTSTLGTGSVKAFVYLPAGAFDMDYYTAAYLTVEGARALTAFSDEYDDRVSAVTDALKPLAKQRAALRQKSLVGEANEKLDDAQTKLDDARADAEQKLADARKKLSDSRAELNDGWAEVNSARATLIRETAESQKKIDDAKRDLSDAQIKLDDGESQYADGIIEYEQGLRDYEDGTAEYEDGLAEYEKNVQKLKEAAQELSAGSSQLDAGYQELTARQGQFDALMSTVLSAVNAQLPAGQQFPDSAALLAAMRADTAGTGAAALTDGALSGLYGLSGLTSADILAALSANPADAQAQAALGIAYGALAESLAAMGIGDAGAFLAAMAADTAGTGVRAAADAALSALHAGLSQPDGSPTNSAYLLGAESQLESAWESYRSGAAQLNDGYDAYDSGNRQLAEAKTKLDDAKAKLDDAKVKLDDARSQLDDSRAKLDDGWADYRDGLKKVSDGERELADQTAEAQSKIADAVEKLRSGEVKYNDGLADYRDGKAEADEKIADAEKKLADARRKVADIGSCEWYVLNRGSNPGYLGFGQDADRMGNLASVFPVLFFLVAALVCLTTMTRMVEEQRVQIGCLKALGYTKWTISRKYLGYGLLPSLVGGILGLALGYTLFPSMIFTAYQIMYEVPDIELHQYTAVSVLSVLAAAGCTTLSSLVSCFAALSDMPAALMRPKAPKPGKRVFLEYIRPLWRHLSFNRKVTARNLFRYHRRFWMTVTGIGGCTALIIAGFGLRSSLLETMDKQYGELYHYTAQIALASNVLDSEREAIERSIDANSSITASLPCRLATATAESDRYSTSAYLEVADAAGLKDFVDLHTYVGGTPLTLRDDGVIIDQKLSELLGLQVGDSFTLDCDGRYTVTVSGICEHYLAHFVYMTPACYQRVFGTAYVSNAWLLTLSDSSKETCDAVFSDLMALSGMASATRMLDTRDTYFHSMERVDFVVVIVIISAAALALVVLYNLSNINITERKRELATIKVLGFYDREVSAYVNRENVVLTAAGIALGIVAGHYLHMWLVRSVEIDLMMFGRQTDPWAYLWAALLTAGFSALVNSFGFLKMRKIDMVESLKSAE